MLELIKIIVDLLVLRDTAQKGEFSWRTLVVGFAAVIGVGIVAAVVVSYADSHPGPTSDKLLLGFLVFAVMTLGSTVIWGWRYQKRLAARKAVQPPAPAAPGQI